MNSNTLNNQYGSSLPVPANSRDSNVQDPLVSDTSDDSLGKHFNKLNISEQVNASTAAHHSTSAVPHNTTTDGSTTVGQDTSAASDQSSPHLQQPSQFLPFYGQPMYAFPPYGQPNRSGFLPPMYPPFMGPTGTQPMLPGYPPYGYSYYQAPALTPVAKTHLTTKSDASFEASSPQVTDDKMDTPPSSTATVNSALPMVPPMSQYHLLYSPQLQVVSTKDGFNTWIKNFISVLEDYHLSELLPDKQGHSKRPASVTERQTVNATLHYYVKDEFLPNWFQTSLKSSDDAYDSIQRAIYLHQQKHDQSNLWSQLKSLSYDGTSNAFIFISKVKAIISLFPDGTSSEVSSLIITILFDALRGSYTSIVKRFAQKTESYTVNDVLDAIQFEYDFNERYNKSHRVTSGKSTSTICSYCQKSGHSVSQCYAKQNKEKASHKSSTRYKNKKSSHHISVTDPTTPDATTSSPGNDDDSLRPTSSDSINADATNNDTSINLNHYMLLDTGSNISIVNDMAFLHDISHDYIPPSIEDTENRPISHEARGILKLRFPGGKIVNLTAYYAPNSDTNIIGALTLERDGIYLCGKTRTLEGKSNTIYAYYRQFDDLPWLSNRFLQFPTDTPKYVVRHLLHKYPLELVHRLFGHVNVESLRQSFKKKTFKHLTYDDVDWTGHATFQCIDCAQGKAKVHNHIEGARLKYQEHYKPFEYLHSDIFGPVTASSIAKFFITFIDEATSYRWVYPLKDKAADTILDTTLSLVNTIDRQYNVKVKAFQFDHGSEYTNDLMTRYFDENGIQYIYTTVGDSRSNGVAERLNLTFLNDCRTLLKASQLPPHLWIFAVQFSAIIRNSVFNKRLGTSPRAMAGISGLDVTTILPFGQPVIVHLAKTHSKLHYRGEQGYALCPSNHSRGYKIYIPANHQIVDSTNYAVLRTGIKIDSNQEYDDSIFDELMNQFSTNEDYEMLRSDNNLPAENNEPTNSNTVYPAENNEPAQLYDANLVDANAPTSGGNDSVPEDIDDTSIRHENDKTKSTQSTDNEYSEFDTALEQFLNDHTTDDTTYINSDTHDSFNLSSHSSNSGGIDNGLLNDYEKQLLNRKRYREESNEGIVQNETSRRRTNKLSVNYIQAINNAENIPNSNLQIDPLSQSIFYHTAIQYNNNQREKKLFQEAYEKEIDQLTKMKTWDTQPVDASSVDAKNIINSMFIFTVKRDGKHKCRLVARGDQQKQDTYEQGLMANTVHHRALMACLSNCLSNNYDIIQLDISSAYLYADLKEDLYIRAPPHMNLKNKVFKLQKSLYGLKQSGANWYKLIKNYLIDSCGMKEVLGWSCVFTKKVGNKLVILCLFVDDIIMFTNNYQFAAIIINTLKDKFDTKTVNDGKQNDKNIYDILGLQIEYVKGEYMNFGMEKGLEEKLPKLNVNLQPKRNAPGPPGKIPEQKDLTVTKEEYKEKVKWMQKIVGLASYVAHKYRFDLLYYVNILARFTLYPSKEIMELAKYLVQYLWCSRSKKLIWYKNQKFNNKNKLTAITDAAFGTQAEYKSQYGNIIYLNGNPIGAKSTRSSLTCTSSTEAEIYAISEAIPILQLVELLIKHIDDRKIEKEIITDSSPSLSSFKNTNSSKFKSKFYTTRLLRSKETVKEEGIKMSYINTKENVADILTKPVEVKDFEHLTKDWIL